MTQIKNADSAYIAHDALAAAAGWARAGDRWVIVLARVPDTDYTDYRYFWHVGPNNGGFEYPFIKSLRTRPTDGRMSANAERDTGGTMFSLVGAASVAAGWHLLMFLDEDKGSDLGRAYIKEDGGARKTEVGDHLRGFDEDTTFPLWGTIGATRRGALGTPYAYGLDIDVAYMAHISDCVPSDAQMSDVWDAFDAGGGRTDLQAITDAIAVVVAAVGTGQIDWAGPLDGRSNSAHVDNVSAGDPVYINCTQAVADGL
jgi:hypothetical protein